MKIYIYQKSDFHFFDEKLSKKEGKIILEENLSIKIEEKSFFIFSGDKKICKFVGVSSAHIDTFKDKLILFKFYHS